MTDSRVRNSADGSLVQKARRQVEIFQSQGNGGRNFQVVRASQWSSSRASTDCCVPLHVASSNKPNQCVSEDTMNGDSPRLSLRRSSLADAAVSDLDRLSYLCRKLHDEAMSNASFWPLNANAITRVASPPALLEGSLDDRFSLTNERRSNSNDDLASSLSNGEDNNFARDCKARRSLQIPNNNSVENDGEDKAESGGARRSRAELIAERARRFEEDMARDNGVKRSFIGTKTFRPIANNDFVKNDPKHPSKINNQIAKISIQDNVQNGRRAMQHVVSSSTPQPQRRSLDTSSTRKANNKTVVHLRNAASPDAQLQPVARCINVTAIKLEKDDVPTVVENNSSRLTETLVNGTTKPAKKVEFCKTEIHFAADSGKVNIVETDGKPPPTNKFRRRRRNHSLNSAINSNQQKSNLPVVHFGDTSYEKYIFGGGKVPPPPDENKTDNNNFTLAAATNGAESHHEDNKKWDASAAKENDSKEIVTRDSFTDTSLDKVMEHVGKFRGGAHTTTVNFLSDESKALAKVAEGKRAGIQFQFASRSLSPVRSNSSDDEEGKVVRTTKITLHLPAPIISSHQPLINNPFSNLKSVRLVMNTMTTASQLLLDTFYKSPKNNSELSLKLKDEDADDADAARRILDKSRMIEDKPSSNFSAPPATSQLLLKDSDQVLLKVVTTHKPIVARVDEQLPAKPSRLNKNQTDEEKVKSHHIEDDACTQAKEEQHCDNASGDEGEPPVYENIFDATSSDGAPLYENFHQVVKTIPVVVVDKSEKIVVQGTTKLSVVGLHRKVAVKISGNEASNKPRSFTPKNENDRSNSRSRDSSTKRRKEVKLAKDDSTRSSQTKKSSTLVQERKGIPTNLVVDKNTAKAKKPVEVVYKTAVYNMKNEKLSKPTKSKEMKGPRLINELICGTKLKKPSDSKKVIKTANVSQSYSKKREMPTITNK